MLRFAWLAALSCVLPELAWAHHHASTARVGESFGLGAFAPVTRRARPHWGSQLEFRLLDFGRTLQADGGDGRATDLGHVRLHLFTASTSIALPSATFFGAGLSLGQLSSTSAASGSSSLWGLGDLELLAGQALLERTASLPLQVQVQATVTAPTGRYQSSPTLSTSVASSDQDGALLLTTYDSRASLGSGAWFASGALASSVWFAERWQAQLATAVSAPVSRTSDGIRWGVDWLIRATTSVELLDERLELLAGSDYRHHTPDRHLTAAVDDGAIGGSRRNEVGLLFGFAAHWLAPVHCRFEGHLPVWQHATRAQLVESFMASAACGVTSDL